MSKLIEKISRRLKFASVLFRKTAAQKFTAGKTGFAYLNRKEQKLKDLLNSRNVTQQDASEYFTQLSGALYDNFKSSGISYRDICDVIAGKLVYTRSGFTLDKVQQVLVDSYCKSNGLFQEVMFDFLHRDHNQELTCPGTSLFGKIDPNTVRDVASEIELNGYAKLPFALPKNTVDELVSWSKNLDYTIIDDSLGGKYFKSKVDFNDTKYAKASAAEADLKNNELVMKVCKDPFILSIIQTSLRAKVDILHLAMWWSFNIGKPSSEAAQYFHYDLDSFRWLKVFIYLTDVGPESGPHIAIPGSHNLGGKNYKLLSKGYSRITDDEMVKNQAGQITEFYGPAGTIIIGDTRCWHKGKELLKGNRLILQPTFSSSAFLKKII